MRVASVLGVALLALALTSCTGDEPAAPSVAGSWQLTSVRLGGADHAVPGDTEVTLVSDTGTTGQAMSGCTLTSFRVQRDGPELRFEVGRPGAVFGCGDPASYDPFDGTLPGVLAAVRRGRRTRSTLVLTGPGERLMFTADDVVPAP